MGIKLPVELEQKFELAQQPPLDEMYFGSDIGRVTFSKMTESQAVKLLRAKSPYIKLKKSDEVAEKTSQTPVENLTERAVDVPFSPELSKKSR